MTLTGILKESFKLLYKEPKIFLPRFVTTGLYTIVIIYLAKVSSQITAGLDYPGHAAAQVDPQVLSSIFRDILPLMLFLAFIASIDFVSYGMYPALVRDFYEKKPVSLKKSLKEALGAWKVILLFGAVTAFTAGLIVLPLQIASAQDVLLYALLSLGGFGIAFIVIVLLFFVVPYAVIEKKGVAEAFRRGIGLSIRHRKDVFSINVVLITISLGTFALMTFTEMTGQGAIAAASIILFIIIRAVQALVYTYISVVNPYFYMQIKKPGSKAGVLLSKAAD
jgi:hypothetical protein